MIIIGIVAVALVFYADGNKEEGKCIERKAYFLSVI